jgi:hypothetical protein
LRKLPLLAAAALATTLAACSRAPETTAARPAAPPPAPVAPANRDAKALLSDEKAVAGYAAYQKAMAPYAKDAMEIFSSAYQKGGSDARKLEEAAKADPRVVAYNQRNDEALAKAGIRQSEVSTFASALTPYLTRVYLARDSMNAAVAAQKKKVSGQPLGIGDEVALKMGADAAEKLKAAREEFVTRYGTSALEVVTRNEPALLEAQDAMMKGALGK